ncbi:MAG: hypothetical protein HY666_01185 [Chloroflexi bacterium]|nr:hypothetical protein [Chloroflexota bacterium]
MLRATNLVGVRFTRGGRVHYFENAGLDLEVNDEVLVETETGPTTAHVVIAPKQLLFSNVNGTLKRVLNKV